MGLVGPSLKVVSSQPPSVVDATGGGYRAAVWVELPVEPSCAAQICLDGNHVKKLHNPTLVEVLCVLDEAEALLGSRGESAEQEVKRGAEPLPTRLHLHAIW